MKKKTKQYIDYFQVGELYYNQNKEPYLITGKRQYKRNYFIQFMYNGIQGELPLPVFLDEVNLPH